MHSLKGRIKYIKEKNKYTHLSDKKYCCFNIFFFQRCFSSLYILRRNFATYILPQRILHNNLIINILQFTQLTSVLSIFAQTYDHNFYCQKNVSTLHALLDLTNIRLFELLHSLVMVLTCQCCFLLKFIKSFVLYQHFTVFQMVSFYSSS